MLYSHPPLIATLVSIYRINFFVVNFQTRFCHSFVQLNTSTLKIYPESGFESIECRAVEASILFSEKVYDKRGKNALELFSPIGRPSASS